MYHHKKEEKGQMLFGIRPVIEAINAGKDVEKIIIQQGLTGELFNELRILLKNSEIPFQYVPVEKLNRVTNKNHQGVIAYVSPVTYQNIENIIPDIYESGKIPLLLILDRITDVRNFGAITRTAECAGVNAIIIPSRGAAQINADAVKTSAGALFNIPICRSENLKHTIDFLKESGLQIVSCTEKTDTYYYEADLKIPTAIIMGSEEDGISEEYLKRSDFRGKIPLIGEIPSLNVSVATGIILYEAVKQRQ